MCGVGGQLTTSRTSEAELVNEVAQIVSALARRGPDGHDTWADGDVGVALGHSRLAILDLSPTGAQPMVSSSGRWVLTYNGEIYNHLELRRELEQCGTRFRGTCDAETLVESFAKWGIEATLQRTNGMFAFGVWDRQERRLTVARDRMGEKPLYWTHDRKRFAFASELKGLRTIPGYQRAVNPRAVSSVLRWGFVIAPHSIYADTFQLLPGHLLEVTVSHGIVRVNEKIWWSLAETVRAGVARQKPTSLEDAAAELEPLLAAAVAARLQSDVPLGAFLSGGIDSTLVAAFAQRALGSTQLQTFTVKMPSVGLDESAAAAAIAAHLGTNHTEVELAEDEALELIPSMGAAWDEPLGDPSMIPSLLLCQTARQHLTVCLGGDGGDELFAGYNRHAMAAAMMAAAGKVPQPVRNAAGRTLGAVPVQVFDRMAKVARPALPERWRVPNSGDKMHKAAKILRGGDSPSWDQMAGVWTLAPDAVAPGHGLAPGGLSAVEELMWFDTDIVLPNNMLVKTDRASMYSSLELRTPFLDPALLEWAWSQPLATKTDGGVGKRVLRALVGQLGLANVSTQPKRGFDPPLADWLRGSLSDWVSDLIASPACVSNGFLQRDEVLRVWREHRDGVRNHEYQLWALLMMENWLHDNV